MLIRESTAQALAIAEVVEKNVEKTVWLKCEYPILNEAIRIAKQYQADIVEQDLQLDCKLTSENSGWPIMKLVLLLGKIRAKLK